MHGPLRNLEACLEMLKLKLLDLLIYIPSEKNFILDLLFSTSSAKLLRYVGFVCLCCPAGRKVVLTLILKFLAAFQE